jgi:hypothetical protein
LQFARQSNGFITVRSFTNDFEVGLLLQQLASSGANNGVVIGQY